MKTCGNSRWKALAEIYTMHSFAPFWNPYAKTGEKGAWHRSLISIFSLKIAEMFADFFQIFANFARVLLNFCKNLAKFWPKILTRKILQNRNFLWKMKGESPRFLLIFRRVFVLVCFSLPISIPLLGELRTLFEYSWLRSLSLALRTWCVIITLESKISIRQTSFGWKEKHLN